MPRGWEDFLPRWLVRAINFLTERRCAEDGADHEGLHEHGDGFYYHTQSLRHQEAKLKSQMEEIEAGMKGAALQEVEQNL